MMSSSHTSQASTLICITISAFKQTPIHDITISSMTLQTESLTSHSYVALNEHSRGTHQFLSTGCASQPGYICNRQSERVREKFC